MFEPKGISPNASAVPAPLDRLAVAYLTVPLFIFLLGWFQWWAAAILVLSCAYAFRNILITGYAGATHSPITTQQIVIAVSAGCAWAILGGCDHLFFANMDWHVRDAVLHDLVVSAWPVGYGLHDGQETLLRAPVGYYLVAAVIGKVTSVPAAYVALLAWTAVGAVLFLLQVLSLVENRISEALVALGVVILFSGADIVGELLNDGPQFRMHWDLPKHIEWWAGSYQYSSMTTQLFWVPNHALAGWLIIGLLFRCDAKSHLNSLLPMLMVAAALWSPLTAIGLVPFVAWRFAVVIFRHRWLPILDFRTWVPALIVGLPVYAYLTLGAATVSHGSGLSGWTSDDAVMSVLRQAQFFILEAGLIGLAICLIRPTVETTIALAVLALLPAVSLGPNNDLVMRSSIPALTVLAISSFRALLDISSQGRFLQKKIFLGGLLLIGAMTPIAEISRALIFPNWPINFKATLIGADCGGFAPHYVAEIGGQVVTHLLRQPTRLPLGPIGPESCSNPANEIAYRRYGP